MPARTMFLQTSVAIPRKVTTSTDAERILRGTARKNLSTYALQTFGRACSAPLRPTVGSADHRERPRLRVKAVRLGSMVEQHVMEAPSVMPLLVEA